MCPRNQPLFDNDIASAVFLKRDAEILENGKLFQNLFGTDSAAKNAHRLCVSDF